MEQTCCLCLKASVEILQTAQARAWLCFVSPRFFRARPLVPPHLLSLASVAWTLPPTLPAAPARPEPPRTHARARAKAQVRAGLCRQSRRGTRAEIVRSGRRGGSLTIDLAIRDVGGEGRRMSRAFYNQKLCCRKDTSSCFVRWLRFKRRNARRRAPKRFAEGPREREAEGRRSPTAPPRVAGASVLHVTLSPDRCPHLAGPAPVSNSGQVPEVH